MVTINDIASINRYLNSIVGISLFIFGILGCLALFLLFTRKRLFSTPCSQYILVAALLDLLLLITNLSSRIATEGFAVSNGFLFTVGVCKIRTWLVPWLGAASLTCKALLSFDQWACTSRSARFRQWSSVNRARLLVVFSTLLWSFPSLPFMIYMDMVQKANAVLVCTNTSVLYAQAFAYFFNPVLFFFLPVFLLFYFGFRAHRNMLALTSNRQHVRRLERQLMNMIITQAVASGFSTVPFGVQYIYTAATMNVVKDPWRTAQESLFFTLAKLSFYVSNTIPFYIYMALSSELRKMTKDLLLCRRLNRVGDSSIAAVSSVKTRAAHLNSKNGITGIQRQLPTIF